MIDKQIKSDLEEYRDKTHAPFWGILIAITSILQGSFVLNFDGYLLEHSEPYFVYLPENTIGIVLTALGVIKILSVLLKANRFKKYSIWGLSAVWTGLFFIALTYSFGTGHPNPSWIFYGMVTLSCYRVSLKGDFNH